MIKRTLIFCFDGTRNGRDDENITNVLKMHRGLRHRGQVPFYWAGPGNEDENNWFEELLGGAFDYGSNDIRDMGYDTLQAAYQPGDRIMAIGFSRGAAIARLFAAKVGEEGVHGNKVMIDFLGCFDTVGAYLPRGVGQQGLFHDLHLSPCVISAYHAVAIHEDRKAFVPNLMNYRKGVTETWFRGIHGDIGGGMPETGLSDTAMHWMKEALKEQGIVVNVSVSPNPGAQIGEVDGMYGREPRKVGVKVCDEWTDKKPNYFEGD